MRHLFLDHLGWKLLSLTVAALLWFSIVDEQSLVTSQSAPIFYSRLSKDFEIGSEVNDRVRLEVRGPSRKLTATSLAGTAVRIDLAAVQQAGEQTFTISTSNIDLPDGVVFLRAVPSQLRLRFDRHATRDVPVQVRLAGPPPAGYRIARQEIKPETLKIGGPENHVQQIEIAQTDAIDVSKVTGQAQFRANTYVADPQVRFESPAVVAVKIWMEKIPADGN